MKTRSIAFRLIAAVLAVELVSSVLVVLLALGYERHAHFRAFDIMLRGRADSVLGAVQDAEDVADNVMLDKADLRVPDEDIYEVYDGSGRLLGRSPNWQGAAAASSTPLATGYSRLEVNRRHYRVLKLEGSRIVDPGEAGGGKLRRVTVVYGAPTERVWEAIHGAVEFYSAGSIVLLLVTGPLIAWLLHRGLQPLRVLAALAGNVSADSWEFSPPASARLTSELAPLTQAIENVLRRLERSFLQQRAFVSDAAHELKTAVAVVKSSLQVLEMKRRSVEEYEAGLGRALADCSRLEEIVSKMLALAREESAAPDPGREPVADAVECLRQTVARLGSVAALRGVRVTVAAQESGAYRIAAGAEECSMLISNLLLNAIQHSPPGSEVVARVGAEVETVKLEIEDHGEGIDPAALPHVFDRFFRGDPSRTRATGGTGLGLAICKAIADRAGGTISIASRLGAGSTVTVRLPLVEMPAEVHAAPSA
ncbi:MAG: HAMP domain-containing sensor histidine kinase [Terracidiphilus sp.]